jgi:hypothetical protein
MKFRNPWIDPRVVQVRPEQAQAYLSRHGWRNIGRATDPHLLRYERADGSEEDPTLFVPVQADGGPALQWMVELIEELARFEDRWATAVLGDILQQAGEEGPAETVRNQPGNSEPRMDEGASPVTPEPTQPEPSPR